MEQWLSIEFSYPSSVQYHSWKVCQYFSDFHGRSFASHEIKKNKMKRKKRRHLTWQCSLNFSLARTYPRNSNPRISHDDRWESPQCDATKDIFIEINYGNWFSFFLFFSVLFTFSRHFFFFQVIKLNYHVPEIWGIANFWIALHCIKFSSTFKRSFNGNGIENVGWKSISTTYVYRNNYN